MMKKPGYQKVSVIKISYGVYLQWRGWCIKCKKLRIHTEPMYMSCSHPTCSKGHYSDGGFKPKKTKT